MSLYAISDLHLSFYKHKPMSRFGPMWENHPQKLERNWRRLVSESDTVLIPGDISWGINEFEAAPDLRFISELPGGKVLCPGNHDYWWNSTSRLNSLHESMTFLKNTHCAYNGIAVCAARGWLCPNDTQFSEHDAKLYNRELCRLKLSLDSAVESGFRSIVLMLHFPPTNDKKERSGFLALIDEYPVTHVLYGHLHGKRAFGNSLRGVWGGVAYQLVSADYLGFEPLKIF